MLSLYSVVNNRVGKYDNGLSCFMFVLLGIRLWPVTIQTLSFLVFFKTPKER